MVLTAVVRQVPSVSSARQLTMSTGGLPESSHTSGQDAKGAGLGVSK